MENVTEKQAISQKILPTLRELGLYASAVFDIRRLNVVNATIHKVKVTTEKNFTYRTDRVTGTIHVTRIK
jgi:hypothetical protein